MPELRRSARVASKPAEPKQAAESEPLKKKTKTSSATSTTTSSGKTAELQVGDKIPDITLSDEDENEINLVEAAKKTKYLIIFAYPKASTPGCTRQVCGFQKNFEFLQKADVTVFGLSADQPKAQKNFVNKQGLTYPLLSDPSKELIGNLGAKKSPSGIKRSHWIFVDGILKIKKIQISPEDSFNGARIDIEKLIAEEPAPTAEEEEAKEEAKDLAKKEADKEAEEEVKELAEKKAEEGATEGAEEEAKEEIRAQAKGESKGEKKEENKKEAKEEVESSK